MRSASYKLGSRSVSTTSSKSGRACLSLCQHRFSSVARRGGHCSGMAGRRSWLSTLSHSRKDTPTPPPLPACDSVKALRRWARERVWTGAAGGSGSGSGVSGSESLTVGWEVQGVAHRSRQGSRHKVKARASHAAVTLPALFLPLSAPCPPCPLTGRGRARLSRAATAGRRTRTRPPRRRTRTRRRTCA